MELQAAVLSVLMGLTPSKWDTGAPAARRSRLEPVSDAIALASRDPQEAAILIALGDAESHFAEYVGAGCEEVPEGAANCDGGKARSYWQAWQSACPAAWKLPRGSQDSVYAFADCAIRRFRGALSRCREQTTLGYWAGGFSGYRQLSRCSWRPAVSRANAMHVKHSLLMRLIAVEER